MSTHVTANDPPGTIQLVTRGYAKLLLAGFALVPLYLIAYLYFFQDPSLKFENHAFHELAIAVATLEGGFVTYVCWRCYRLSGEPLLRWLTLGFLGFSLVYALHGAFTGMAHHNIWLFLLYGPASRLAMSILIFVGQLSYSRAADSEAARADRGVWTKWIALFVLIDVAVAVIAYSPVAGAPWVRVSMEGGALLFSTVNVVALVLRRIRSPLMTIYGISVASFALSSLAFILGRPWNHMWWLAHAIFAAGFVLLSLGVVQAFHTTRSFSKIYSQEELFARLREAMARTERALQELQRTNEKLEHMAATDPLTGVANRREFIDRVEAEIARAKRNGAPFSLLALDLDHFKAINDSYGHQAGDQVLQRFVKKCVDAVRPFDGVARVGGEEFMVLLPQAALETARLIGERIRAAIAGTPFEAGIGKPIAVTVSVGVSEFGRDGETIDAMLRKADERLYRAKHQGRNQVVAV
ncbi:GGDEF domain-containing protein [Burkholderia stagnalis]|uniref:GGDEF domain-containing protein n=1 Tax=Burkholderia stagnalis TaxID=1503054 RepID=UPI000F55AEA1|nr:GGDEF domain-containing protein [Burkholderia stagnalis]RQQ73149.1 GGDEF domain-containing protein [Burkholderia stagnalis]RQQ74563.1 GGDEF domain-containing protein [Burkholderia stagnalis]RQQ86795.1 GGDEF domain-containing protein [Burkholderia stagnalis]RQQ95463.1 GGDEF domain-containing protein [Burkholderia stagnalis]